MNLNKRIICTGIVLFLIIMVSGCEKSLQQHDLSIKTLSFRDIPGITREEVNAIEELREQDRTFVYGMISSKEAFRNIDGDIRGYAALLCEWFTNVFGIPFIPQIYTRDELLDGLNNGEIDFTGDLSPNEERRNTYYMTTPIAERVVDYFVIEGSAPLSEIAVERPLRYAFLEGSANADGVASSHNSNIYYELVFARDFDHAYRMLKNGEIDAFISEDIDIAAFAAYGDVTGKNYFPPVFSPVSLAAQNPDLEPVINLVQKILDNGGSNYLTELYNQGNSDYLQHTLFIKLSESEREYIRINPVILYVTQYNNYPMSFYNENEKQWQGIIFDLLRETEELTGISFQLAHGDEFLRWPVLLEMVESGEAAFVTELIRTEARMGRFLYLDTMLASEFLTLVSLSEQRNYKLHEIKNLTVGVVRNTAQTEAFFRWFPDHEKIIEYNDTREALLAMRKDGTDLVMSSTANLFYMTNYLELTGYKANILFDDTIQESTIGLNIEQETLRSIIDKALDLIDIKAITDDWKSRSFDYRYKLIEAQRPWLIGAVIALAVIIVLLMILYLNGRLRRKIIAEQAEAEMANRAKSRFLATMSHEIRTPMNSIMGFAELASDSDSVPQMQDYLVKITDSTKWLLRIINDILDISKIEAGKMELDYAPFSLSDIFFRCQSVILPSVKEKGLDLSVYAEKSEGKKLMGDPVKLYQVLMNLLSNAVKFTSTGTVKFSSSIKSVNNGSATVYFEVKDTGIGMTAKQIDKVFGLFIQADSSTTRDYGGTGLGLAISKNIVELMGGKLLVESLPGIGSTFSFELTFETIDMPEEKPEKANMEITERPYFDGLILVCDDNSLNQEVICAHLERVGLKTITVENGKAGVEMVQERRIKNEKPFDLIFMDIFMPVMDGMEAAANIMEMNTGTPIVAMTANVMISELEKYKRNGMSDCLGKPFVSQELWRILLKYLKPVQSEPLSRPINEQEEDDNLQKKLRINFLKENLREENKTVHAKIMEAVASGDTKLAHRLAHSLKGNAGLIGKTGLRNAAAEVEALLKDGLASVWENKMSVLKDELMLALEELKHLYNDTGIQEKKPTLNREQTLALFDKLEPMLENDNTDSIDLLEELRSVSGADELIKRIESFDFKSAVKMLEELRKNLMIMENSS